MKRVLALLTALLLLGAFAACGKTADDTTTAAPVIGEDYTTRETEAPPEDTTEDTGEESTLPEEETTLEEETSAEAESTKEGESTAEATTTKAAADPTKMNKAQLIQYYNDAVNLVRTGKPGYTKVEVLKVNDFKTSILGGAVDGLISGVVKNAMPGNPESSSRKKGESNVDHFMMDQQASAVKASDVDLIVAKKEGANYVISLSVGREVNPAKNGASKFSRVFQIQTRQEVLDDLAGNGLTGEVNNCTLTYRDGSSVITVNPQGQIIEAHTGFFVDVVGKNMHIAIFNPDIDAFQQSNWDYTNFSW